MSNSFFFIPATRTALYDSRWLAMQLGTWALFSVVETESARVYSVHMCMWLVCDVVQWACVVAGTYIHTQIDYVAASIQLLHGCDLLGIEWQKKISTGIFAFVCSWHDPV